MSITYDNRWQSCGFIQWNKKKNLFSSFPFESYDYEKNNEYLTGNVQYKKRC